MPQLLAQKLHTQPRCGAGQECRHTELTVKADDRLVRREVHEVGLVETDERTNPALRGTGEVADDQVWLQIRLDQRPGDPPLIDLGDADAFAAAPAPRQAPAA